VCVGKGHRYIAMRVACPVFCLHRLLATGTHCAAGEASQKVGGHGLGAPYCATTSTPSFPLLCPPV
jgi:hypothetical protein